MLGLNLVAWTGIEPVTSGFSIAVLVKYLVFFRVAGELHVIFSTSCCIQLAEFDNKIFIAVRKWFHAQQFFVTAGAVKNSAAVLSASKS